MGARAAATLVCACASTTVVLSPPAGATPSSRTDSSDLDSPVPDEGWWFVESHGRWLWEPSVPKKGSFIVSGQAGSFSGGGIEVYATDVVSLHADFGFEILDLDDEAESAQEVEHSIFDLPSIPNGELSDGWTYLIDVGTRFHLYPKGILDPYLGLGVSWFGYDLTAIDETSLGGGSLFGRVNAGFRWHCHILSLGVDVGWYPVEITRLEFGETPTGENRVTGLALSDEERFRMDRFSVTGRVGLRF